MKLCAYVFGLLPRPIYSSMDLISGKRRQQKMTFRTRDLGKENIRGQEMPFDVRVTLPKIRVPRSNVRGASLVLCRIDPWEVSICVIWFCLLFEKNKFMEITGVIISSNPEHFSFSDLKRRFYSWHFILVASLAMMVPWVFDLKEGELRECFLNISVNVANARRVLLGE